jgi:hypothetical protein
VKYKVAGNLIPTVQWRELQPAGLGRKIRRLKPAPLGARARIPALENRGFIRFCLQLPHNSKAAASRWGAAALNL